MNGFIKFSIVLIVISLVILIFPLTHFNAVMPIQEGFKPAPHRVESAPVAANQMNLSGTAGLADGSSAHQHLLDNLLKKHDRLAEGFKGRDTADVSANTTKKNGIASSSAGFQGEQVNVPKVGCFKDKCTKIDDPMTALDGNCINPPRAGGDPNEVDYSIKYCPAFQPKDGAYSQECLNCGYYKYTSKCTPNPNNPKKPCIYKTYTFDSYNDGPIPGTGGGGGGGGGAPNCNTCKYDVDEDTQCVLPGCYSADNGRLPFPDDSYNFDRGCFYYNPDPKKSEKTMFGMAGREPGYYCPPISKGETYNGGGGDDPCYTKQDPTNLESSIIDYSTYVKIEKKCINDKAKSEQKFAPHNVDDNPSYKKRRQGQGQSQSQKGQSQSQKDQSQKDQDQDQDQLNQQYVHSGSINVYHHYSSKDKSNRPYKNKSYLEPIPGATVLGYL